GVGPEDLPVELDGGLDRPRPVVDGLVTTTDHDAEGPHLDGGGVAGHGPSLRRHYEGGPGTVRPPYPGGGWSSGQAPTGSLKLASCTQSPSSQPGVIAGSESTGVRSSTINAPSSAAP